MKIKLKLKLTLLETFSLIVAVIVLFLGGWILSLIIVSILTASSVEIPDEKAFININIDTEL